VESKSTWSASVPNQFTRSVGLLEQLLLVSLCLCVMISAQPLGVVGPLAALLTTPRVFGSSFPNGSEGLAAFLLDVVRITKTFRSHRASTPVKGARLFGTHFSSHCPLSSFECTKSRLVA